MKNLKFILLALVHLVFLTNSAKAHYDPNIGRWLSRDPIMENGGINLYGMCDNNLISRYDLMGAMPVEEPDYQDNPQVMDLPLGGTLPNRRVRLGEAIMRFGLKLEIQHDKKCCVKAEIWYLVDPFVWVDSVFSFRTGNNPVTVVTHEQAHVKATNNRLKEIANALKQETECYSSELEADQTLRDLSSHYKKWYEDTLNAERDHSQGGDYGTPPDGGID